MSSLVEAAVVSSIVIAATGYLVIRAWKAVHAARAKKGREDCPHCNV